MLAGRDPGPNPAGRAVLGLALGVALGVAVALLVPRARTRTVAHPSDGA